MFSHPNSPPSMGGKLDAPFSPPSSPPSGPGSAFLRASRRSRTYLRLALVSALVLLALFGSEMLRVAPPSIGETFQYTQDTIVSCAVAMPGSAHGDQQVVFGGGAAADPSALAPNGAGAGATGVAQTLGALTALPPIVPTAQDPNNYKMYSEARLRQLAICAAGGNCHPNADKVVIFAALHCHWAVFDSYKGGEGVWCLEMIKSLERQGFTVLLARNDWDYALHLHRQIPSLVRAVVADPKGHNGQDVKNYLKTKARLDGIPAWKYFHFYYFTNPYSTVVGNNWVVSAENEWREPGSANWRNCTYLGYALEPAPEDTIVVPPAERPMRAYILSKRVQYFYPEHGAMFTRDMFTRAAVEIREVYPDFEFVGGFVDDRSDAVREREGPMTIPEGVRDLGKMTPEVFDAEVAQARLMVGIGMPGSSPSPYRALAHGVPFLNPHRVRDGGRGDNPLDWRPQHDGLRTTSAPFVYNVEADDYVAFKNAILAALATPIEPFRFPWHARAAFDARMADLVDRDWRADAAHILALRRAGNETQTGTGFGDFEL